MKDKKNIDRLYQEKFKDFEVAPDTAVWKKIKAQQQQKEKRILVIPFWYRMAGVAALLAILLTAGYLSLNPLNQTPSQDIVTKETPIIDQKETASPDTRITNVKKEESVISPDSEDNIIPISKTKLKTKNKYTATTTNRKTFNNYKKNTPIDQNYAVTTAQKKEPNTSGSLIDDTQERNNVSSQPITLQHEDKGIVQNSTAPDATNLTYLEKELKKDTDTLNTNKKSLFDAIAQEEVLDQTNEPIAKNAKKWNISPNLAPVYYGTVGNGSSIDPRFADNTKNGQVNLSYGVQVAYTVNKRLSVRSGVHKVDLSYNTEDVGFSASSAVGQNLQRINYDDNARAILITDLGGPSGNNVNEFVTSGFNREAINRKQNKGLLNQQIGYIEVPIEMKYALVDKKFGVNMIGGMSTLFLQNNEISIEAGNFETTIGEANNINNISFTGNLGIGVDYNITDQFQLNLEPILKYQFDGFDGRTEGFKPYYFGVYTGVSLRF